MFENSLQIAEAKESLRGVLQQQARELDALIHILSEVTTLDPDRQEICDVVLLMVQGLGVSMHSILRLTENMDMAIRDCFGIARSASELAVNIAYIAASPPEVAKRARLHAMQKSYRDLARKGTIGGTSISVSSALVPPSSTIPGMDEALAAFTDKKGREVRDWTDINIDGRVKAVAAFNSQASTALAGSVFSIYRHSSELLHGTYFGIVHYWAGSGAPSRTKEDFERIWLTEHFITVFTAAFFGAVGVVEACSTSFGICELRERQDKLQQTVAKLIGNTSPEPR